MSDDKLQRIADWHARVLYRRQAGQFERDVWIEASRRFFKPGERGPCWVCGKFKSIAQAHHVVPLNLQYDRGFDLPDSTHVWLCPNHHIIAHAFIEGERSMNPEAARARSRRRAPIYRDLSKVEFEKMIELLQMSGRSAQ